MWTARFTTDRWGWAMNTSNAEAWSAALEAIYIENHPDHRASGLDLEHLCYWAVRNGLLSRAEANNILSGE
jgi:hypothetical protein